MDTLTADALNPDGRDRSLSVSFQVHGDVPNGSPPTTHSQPRSYMSGQASRSQRRDSYTGGIPTALSGHEARFAFSSRDTPLLRHRRPSLYRPSGNEFSTHQIHSSVSTLGRLDLQASSTLQGAASTFTAGDDDLQIYYDEGIAGGRSNPWINQQWYKRLLRVLSLLSLVSAALNTPVTIYSACWLNEAILAMDIFLAAVFTVNMLAKMKYRGIFKGRRGGGLAFFQGWLNTIDFIALLSIYASIALQLWENSHQGRCIHPRERPDSGWSVVRCPRAMIMLRAGKLIVNRLNLPRELIQKILRRSGKQLLFVSLFFIFFISTFAMVGTQIFSDLDHHCTTAEEVNVSTLSDLAMPDQYCAPKFGPTTVLPVGSLYSQSSYLATGSGIQNRTACPLSNSSDVVHVSSSNPFGCPGDMTCRDIDSELSDRRLGTFEHLGTSLLTVYESSSQELWVFLMYANAEVVQDNAASYTFFIILIFLLSWLVENVFIAILIETFADMRAEVFVNLVSGPQTVTEVLRETDIGLQLVSLKGVSVQSNLDKVRSFLLSRRFYGIVVVFVVVNSLINALGTAPDVVWPILDRNKVVYPIEIFFTVAFNLEVVALLWCLGFRPYFRQRRYVFQFVLAVGSTVNIIPNVWKTEIDFFHIFQVLRLVRIISAHKGIEKFTHTILGGGTRLVFLLVMTLLFLIAFSLISQNLFCYVHGLRAFDTFPHAFVSMFQMIMQEGWVELTSLVAMSSFFPYTLTSIYFVFFHLFASLYLLSTFVAVILDNLEYPESVKREKQLQYDEILEDGGSALPFRLRLFQRFKPNPRIVRLNNMPADFTQPLISETVMRAFIESGKSHQQEGDQPKPVVPTMDTSLVQKESITGTGYSFERTLSTRSGLSFQTLTEVPLARPLRHGPNGSHLLKRQSSDGPVSRRPEAAVTPAPAEDSWVEQTYQKNRSVHESILQRVIELRDLQASSEENGDLLIPEGRVSRLKRSQEKRHRKRVIEEDKLREDYRFFDKVLFILDRDSPIRRLCQRIADARPPAFFQDDAYHIFGYKRALSQVLASSTYLEWFMVIVTIFATISLALEGTQLRPTESTFHFVNDVVFVGAMSFELAVKLLAHGALFTPNAIFGTVRSCLDLIIYLTTIIYLCILPASLPSSQLSLGMEILLVLRCFRPLRMVSLIPQLRRVIFELFIGRKEGGKTSWQGKDIAYVTIIFFMFIYLFASYGTQLFSGLLYRCNDHTITTQEMCVGEFEVPLTVSLHLFLNTTPPLILVPRVWRSPRLFHFDDVLSAFLALFEVITLEGWLDVRDVLTEQTSVLATIYIHCYVFLGVLVGLTLFVGVIIFNFNKNSGTALLTVDQRRFYDLLSRLIIVQPNRFPPRPSHSRIRSLLFDMISSQKWKNFDIFILLLNSGTLAIQWTFQHTGTMVVMSICIACNCIFLLQTAVKMTALSPSGFFQSHRNAFEFALGSLGLAYIILFILSHSQSYERPQLWEYTREVGIASVLLRFISITGKGEIMKMLMLTVVQTVFKSSYIILCLAVFVLTYALIGNVLFSAVKYGESLGRHANFESAGNALVMMVRIITGEDWNRLMRDAMVDAPNCIPDEDCGSALAAVFYFCSFYLMVAFVFLNLFIAVLVENFSLFYSSDEDALLSTKDLQDFKAKWDILDYSRSGEIPIRFVSFLILLLESGLYVPPDENRMLFEEMVLEMERHAQHAQRRTIKFQDVLAMLAYRCVDINTSLILEEFIARKQLEDNIRLEVSRRIIRSWMTSCIKTVRKQMEKGETVLFTGGVHGKEEAARATSLHPGPDVEAYQVRTSSSDETLSHGILSSLESCGVPFSTSTISEDRKMPLTYQGSSSLDESPSVFNTSDTQAGTLEKTADLNQWFNNYTSDEDNFSMDFS